MPYLYSFRKDSLLMFVCYSMTLLRRRVCYYIFMKEIHVEDCDKCWNPYWEDELVDGLCSECQ